MKFLRRPWMTAREYHANKEGLNIVFGAVLGFVLAGAENLDAAGFAMVLIGSAGAVITILYIFASPYRLAYAGLAVVYALSLPFLVQRITGDSAPEKLMPTLLIWTLVAIFLEFAPRGKDEQR